jgi:segregation and condensation protein A
VSTSAINALDLDLDVFSGPFGLLLALILREEVDLLELALADIVLAYLDHLQARGELDLETTTEFVVLIAALLELKSKLMLIGEHDQDDLLELEPEQAAHELLARMLDARRYRAAAGHLRSLLEREHGFRFRQAPPPAHLRRFQAQPEGSQDPAILGDAIGRLLAMPPKLSLHHLGSARVSVAERLAHLRNLLQAGTFSFDDAVRGADRMTVAVTLFALLELYKRGEADWRQSESFGEIAISPAPRPAALAGVSG